MKSTRNKNVDILRSFALLYMVIYHVFVITGMSFNHQILNDFVSFGGEIGVSIFFVISGFSIYKLLNKNKDTSYKDYIIGRLKRIGPHYYISIFVMLLFSSAGVYLAREHILNILMHMVFLHNLVFNFHGAISGVLWTMGVIFQFYLFAPLIKKAIDKKPVIVLLISIIITIISKYFIFRFLNHNNYDGMYYFIYGRQLIDTLDAFVLGMFVSKFDNKKIIKFNIIGELLFSVFLIFIILIGVGKFGFVDPVNSFSVKGLTYYVVLDIIIAGMIYFLTQIEYKENYISKFFLTIAKHEYAIYVWHLLLLNNFVAYSAFYVYFRGKSFLLTYIIILLFITIIPIIIDLLISQIDFNKILKKRNN